MLPLSRQLVTSNMKFSSFLFLSSTFKAASSFAVASPEKSSAAGGAGVHRPVGKDGEGAYTASTKGCFDVIATATPLVVKEIEKAVQKSIY